jgi:hypothetical protein
METQNRRENMSAFDKMIGSGKAKAATKKKGAAPEIVLPDELSDDLDTLLKAKADKKSAEARIAKAEKALIEYGVAIQDRDGLSGNYSGTYELAGGSDTRVKFITSDRFSVSQDEEVHEAIVDLVGDKYDDVIERKVSVSLRPKVFKDKDLQKLVTDLVGDHFDELFETSSKLVAKPGLKESIFDIAGDKDTLADLRDLLPQVKPSIR